MIAQANTYDAIVVGSGISGGWAAKELTGLGLKVLRLERGCNVRHIEDYSTSLKQPWELPHRGKNWLKLRQTYLIHSRDLLAESSAHFWANDADSPSREKKPL